jgi:NCAIR mutase (PurE)-related protein
MDGSHRAQTGFADIGLARIDTDRLRRTGIPEVVFGESKTPDQIVAAMRTLFEAEGFALATRVAESVGIDLAVRLPGATYHMSAKTLRMGMRPRTGHTIGVLCAGTSDLPVAAEAADVAEAFGNTVVRRSDVGVAGLHRLLADFDELATARALIVVAGMEGALPSVVAGLTSVPVIAVPTSVGYGAAFEGIAALLGMLSSCAPGIGVVNIDNGFGAAALAHKIANA